MPKNQGYEKPTYAGAVKDRVKELLGVGVGKVRSTGTGATLGRRSRDLDAAIDRQTTDSNNR